jgi:hypothetical protein
MAIPTLVYAEFKLTHRYDSSSGRHVKRHASFCHWASVAPRSQSVLLHVSEESWKNDFFQYPWIPSNSPADTPNRKLAVYLYAVSCAFTNSPTAEQKYRHNTDSSNPLPIFANPFPQICILILSSNAIYLKILHFSKSFRNKILQAFLVSCPPRTRTTYTILTPLTSLQ